MTGLKVRWGTWEELILGGAVLRHGTNVWDAVAAELRARTPTPNLFTPKECRAKYEHLQEQYSGSDAWFEELRKRRVAELKRDLEKSNDSIGSLQSKLESLTSERETGSNFRDNNSQTESASPIEDAEGIDSSSKEVSRDGSSAGSFTDRTGKDWGHRCENVASVSVQENNLMLQHSEDASMDKFGCGCLGIGFGSFKKKRGKRKRKGCTIVKEGSVGDSDMLNSAALVDREGSAEGSNQDTILAPEDHNGTWMGEDDAHLDFAGILDSITKLKDALIFGVRLESQKRARYKKIIRRHVDFRNISWRIGNGSISSAKELFRDLLLLCNNALVFYPKVSAEHKSALVLRDLVNKTLRQSFSSRDATCSYSDDEDERVGKPKKLGTGLQHSTSKNEMVAGKEDRHKLQENAAVAVKTEGAPHKENSRVAGKTDGDPVKEKAAVAGTAVKEKAAITVKGAISPVKAKAAVTTSKVVGNSLKENAFSVTGKGTGTSWKVNGAAIDKGAATPLTENGRVAGKGDSTSIMERGKKGCRADTAAESPVRKRGMGRRLKGGQRGGCRRRQESPNKGRKRAVRG